MQEQLTQQIHGIVNAQRRFFRTGATRTYHARLKALRRLQTQLLTNEKNIVEALHKDLGRPEFESYVAEIGFVKSELRYNLSHLKRWMKPERRTTPLVLQPARSWILKEPRGVVLVIGPWNYPLQLLIAPVIAAIAAGNTVVLKTSEFVPHTSRVIKTILTSAFTPEWVAVLDGSDEMNESIMEPRYDHVFFTGGSRVGKIIAEKAASKLTPCTLELGGKSPAIVCSDAHLEESAKRIVWGKLLNAGQTCIAPDYVLVEHTVEKKFLQLLALEFNKQLGADVKGSSDYSRIVDRRHMQRLVGLLAEGHVVVGGNYDVDARFFEPTVLTQVPLDSTVMREEIFGPILPVIPFHDLADAKQIVERSPNPLALYVFTRNRHTETRLLNEIPFGGGTVNDTLIHIANPGLPFGGIGDSGKGAYHGRFGFDAFTHHKAVMKKPSGWDLPLRYRPYRRFLWLIRLLMR